MYSWPGVAPLWQMISGEEYPEGSTNPRSCVKGAVQPSNLRRVLLVLEGGVIALEVFPIGNDTGDNAVGR